MGSFRRLNVIKTKAYSRSKVVASLAARNSNGAIDEPPSPR